jgi:hypothetical protein
MDVTFLRSMYAHPGPWVSVYLDDRNDVGSTREEVELRWRSAREVLAAENAPADALAAAETAWRDADENPGKHGVALFAGSDAEAFHEWVPVAPAQPDAVFDTLPHVLPLLYERGDRVTWLRVLVDRTAATIEYASTGSVPRRTEVQGSESFPIRKVKAGDWMQARFQREAETTWQRNAGEAAEAVTHIADDLNPDVLVIAGDVQARRLLQEQLPVRWQERSVLTEGSRAAGADTGALEDVTLQLIAETAAAKDEQVLERLRERSGEWSVAGLAATVEAANRAQIDTLVVDPDKLGGKRLRMTADDLLDLDQGNGSAPTADAGDALVRAAARSGAGVVVLVPEQADLRDGAAAVLRYRDESTT